MSPDNKFVLTLVAIAAGISALYVIWRKAIVPFFRGVARLIKGIDRIADATPVLLGIAEEFRPNGGHSLRDVVDSIERKQDDWVHMAHDTNSALTAHLEKVSWASERAEVFARLALMEASIHRTEGRQRRLIEGVIAAMQGHEGDFQLLVEGISHALNGGSEEDGT